MSVRLIYTGGTIGCDGDPLAPLPAEEFRARWTRHVPPTLGEAEESGWVWLDPPLDSSEMTPEAWGRLARLALEAAAGDEAPLLLHGTDTMAWSAAALAFLMTLCDETGAPAGRLGVPVVLTGAQRPLFDGDGLRAGTDALDNLRAGLNAFALARAEVMVAFGGLTLRGPRVMKMSTRDDRAFSCPRGTTPAPPLAAAAPAALLDQLDRLAPHLGEKAVLTVTPGPTEPTLLVKGIEGSAEKLGEKLGAVHLNGYGIGNFPARSHLAPLLDDLHARGVAIIAGSQVPHGDVAPGDYGAGRWLVECGALPAADMTPAAVHAKLQVALAHAAEKGWQLADIERFFATPLAGERRD